MVHFFSFFFFFVVVVVFGTIDLCSEIIRVCADNYVDFITCVFYVCVCVCMFIF